MMEAEVTVFGAAKNWQGTTLEEVTRLLPTTTTTTNSATAIVLCNKLLLYFICEVLSFHVNCEDSPS
jgi:hypothetical protein